MTGGGEADEATSAGPADALAARRRRMIVTVTGVALVALVTGVVMAGQIRSPAEEAARRGPPNASNVTAQIESRVLESQVVTRGNAVFDDAAGVVLETGGGDGAAIVTGQVPAVGETIEAGRVMLQLSGRPVIALPGAVPVYRSLKPGLAGPDVAQLKAALAELGLNAGDPANDVYDQSTAAAVADLYGSVGYAPPLPAEQATERMDTAEDDLPLAEERVTEAEAAVAEASTPPTQADILRAEGAVTDADQTLATARAEGDPTTIRRAETELAIAVAERDALVAPRNTSIQAAALARAQAALTAAQGELATAQFEAGTPLPAAEVVFLPNLPRRIDKVNVTRGTVVSGSPVLQVSGTELVVVASVRESEADLLAEGMPVQIQSGELELTGTIRTIRTPAAATDPAAASTATTAPPTTTDDGQGGGGGGGGGSGVRQKEAVVALQGLTPDQVAAIQGANVRVVIPVQATQGEVLAVPLAALTIGANGESRVQVQRGGETELVEVEVGLVAQGMAEIRPVDAELTVEDRVVVGK